MTPSRLLLATAALLLAWGWTHAGSAFVDLGDGLLLRADGTVVAAWELPECHLAPTDYDAQAAPVGQQAGDVWRARLERDR